MADSEYTVKYLTSDHNGFYLRARRLGILGHLAEGVTRIAGEYSPRRATLAGITWMCGQLQCGVLGQRNYLRSREKVCQVAGASRLSSERRRKVIVNRFRARP